MVNASTQLTQQPASAGLLSQLECNKTILVIEDDAFVRCATCELLVQAGHHVLEAANAAIAGAVFALAVRELMSLFAMRSCPTPMESSFAGFCNVNTLDCTSFRPPGIRYRRIQWTKVRAPIFWKSHTPVTLSSRWWSKSSQRSFTSAALYCGSR